MQCVWSSEKYNSAFYQAETLDFLGSLDSGIAHGAFIDPPYKLSNGGSSCQGGRRVSVDKGSWDKSQGIEIDHQFNLVWLAECQRILKPNGTIWVTGTKHNIFSIGFAMQSLGLKLLNSITWVKPSPPPNLGCRVFTDSAEHLLWAANGDDHTDNTSNDETEHLLWAANGDGYTFHYQKMRAENGNTQMQTVWEISPPGKLEKLHGSYPGQKPVKLIARSLVASTNPGDLVIDCFAGSSSTGVAAIGLGRRYLGCDRFPDAIALSIKRLSDFD